ncbi:MAG: hypothetical protein PVJ15_06700, partial [Gammaproteobacteria bacterium]
MASHAFTPRAINRHPASDLPAALQGSVAESWESFAEACREAHLPLPRDPDLCASLQRVWACSEFVAT